MAKKRVFYMATTVRESTFRLLRFFIQAAECDVEGCSQKATEVCRRCFEAMYCSPECQSLSHDAQQCPEMKTSRVVWNLIQYAKLKETLLKAKYEKCKLEVGPLPPVEEMSGLPSPERVAVQQKEIQLLGELIDELEAQIYMWDAVGKAMGALEGVSESDREKAARKKAIYQERLSHYQTELERRNPS